MHSDISSSPIGAMQSENSRILMDALEDMFQKRRQSGCFQRNIYQVHQIQQPTSVEVALIRVSRCVRYVYVDRS